MDAYNQLEVRKQANHLLKQIYFVPREHDMLSDNGEQYLERYGKGTKGTGYYFKAVDQ